MVHGEANVLSPAAKELIRVALREDLGDRDDITSQAICPANSVVHAKIIAKQDGILCGVSVAAQGVEEFCYADLTGDGQVGLNDLAQLLANYGDTGAAYEDGDLDADGDVDLQDLAELLARYGDICW